MKPPPSFSYHNIPLGTIKANFIPREPLHKSATRVILD
jgi:hypothetical protein